MKKIVIELTDDQFREIQNHLSVQSNINAKEETFSGYGFNLSCSEMGTSWLEIEMNSKIDIGEVNWKFE